MYHISGWRRRQWHWIIQKIGHHMDCGRYWWRIDPSCGRCVLWTNVLCGTMGTCTSGATRMNIGKLIFESINHCSRFCHIIFTNIPMLCDIRAPNLLVKFKSWQLVVFVEVTPRTVSVNADYFRDKFLREISWKVVNCGRTCASGWAGTYLIPILGGGWSSDFVCPFRCDHWCICM